MSAAMKEDVYESEDLPEVDRNAAFDREDTNDPNIELIHVDVDAAKRRFQGRFLNCDDVDFSDSIANRRRKAYGSSAYVLEIVGKDYDKEETPEQKFNRLTYEIAELAEELKGAETQSSNSLFTPSALNQMLEEVKSMQVEKKSGDPVLKQPVTSLTHKTEGTDSEAVLSLEKRLRKLENLVGPATSGAVPLCDLVEDIRFRIDAINPAYVDGLDGRLNSLLAKLEQVKEKRGSGGGADLESKVDELVQLMEKWDGVCAGLPSQLKKVAALSRLHEHAQQFSEKVSRLVGIREQMEKALASDRIAIHELQTMAKEEVGALVDKINSLEARLKKAGK